MRTSLVSPTPSDKIMGNQAEVHNTEEGYNLISSEDAAAPEVEITNMACDLHIASPEPEDNHDPPTSDSESTSDIEATYIMKGGHRAHNCHHHHHPGHHDRGHGKFGHHRAHSPPHWTAYKAEGMRGYHRGRGVPDHGRGRGMSGRGRGMGRGGHGGLRGFHHGPPPPSHHGPYGRRHEDCPRGEGDRHSPFDAKVARFNPFYEDMHDCCPPGPPNLMGPRYHDHAPPPPSHPKGREHPNNGHPPHPPPPVEPPCQHHQHNAFPPPPFDYPAPPPPEDIQDFFHDSGLTPEEIREMGFNAGLYPPGPRIISEFGFGGFYHGHRGGRHAPPFAFGDRSECGYRGYHRRPTHHGPAPFEYGHEEWVPA